MHTRCKRPDTGDDAESFVLEGEEMWAMRVIDEHLEWERSSQNQADTSSKDAE